MSGRLGGDPTKGRIKQANGRSPSFGRALDVERLRRGYSGLRQEGGRRRPAD